MALPTRDTDAWMSDFEFPSRLFGIGSDDYELYEEDGEFVLTVNVPGFEREEIDVAWDDGRLNIAAEHAEEDRGRRKTYHRTFRFPKDVDPDEIAARYRNGVLEVTLPVVERTTPRGTPIEVEG
jgi:HSP20 family protein